MPYAVLPYLFDRHPENGAAIHLDESDAAWVAGGLYEEAVASWAVASDPAAIQAATRHLAAMHRQMVRWGGAR